MRGHLAQGAVIEDTVGRQGLSARQGRALGA